MSEGEKRLLGLAKSARERVKAFKALAESSLLSEGDKGKAKAGSKVAAGQAEDATKRLAEVRRLRRKGKRPTS